VSHPKIIERRPNNAPSLSNVLDVAIAELHDMLLRCPVNTDEPCILRRGSRPAFSHSQDPQLTINRATTLCADAVTLTPSRHHAPSATLTSSACCAVS
jgi:hypothetical protein